MEKSGRNAPCPCGSGKKYKQCCLSRKAAATASAMMPTQEECDALVKTFTSGRHAEALKQAKAMTLRYPQHGFGWKASGTFLKALGRNEDALIQLQKAAALLPDDAETHSTLGAALNDLGRFSEAEASHQCALKLSSHQAAAYLKMGITLQHQGRLIEAEANYRRALQLKPDFVDALNNLGAVLKDLERMNEAETCYRKALDIDPTCAAAHCNLGNTLIDLGRPHEAETSYRQALQIDANLAMAYSNLLLCLTHGSSINTEALFFEHCQFGKQFEAPLRTLRPAHTNSREAERLLRVGFVSGDLRNHAVAFFIETILQHLCESPQLALHAYSNHGISDSTVLRMKKYFVQWNIVNGMSDDTLAKKIHADKIDILIDLSGHTALNRLPVFARKPAPIQASWMGYAGTTGLQAMDYYLADRFLLPPGDIEKQFVEKIVRLPANAPFLPATNAPAVNSLPALSNGYITFGSFNRLSKLSHDVVSLWAKLLLALPNSKMVLAAMPEEGENDTLIKWFTEAGIDQNRLSFHSRCKLNTYLELHRNVDICLDTFPYNGGTTTLHALWMGVPTLTLAGQTAVGRAGAAIISHVGLEAFIAHDADDFVKKGVLLTENLSNLTTIRAGLRERFEQSAIGKPELIATSLERALRTMWQRWCAGLPPESFEITCDEATDNLPVKPQALIQ